MSRITSFIARHFRQSPFYFVHFFPYVHVMSHRFHISTFPAYPLVCFRRFRHFRYTPASTPCTLSSRPDRSSNPQGTALAIARFALVSSPSILNDHDKMHCGQNGIEPGWRSSIVWALHFSFLKHAYEGYELCRMRYLGFCTDATLPQIVNRCLDHATLG